MKANLLFFITLIVCSQTFATLYKSKESSMEFIVSELVELNKAAKTEPFKIQSILSSIATGARGTLAATNKVFAGIEGRCGRGSSKLTAFIKNLSADLLADGARKNQAQDKIKNREKEAAKLKAQILAGRNGVANVAKKLNEEHENHRRFLVEATYKDDVCQTLHNIITDELVNGAKAGAFVQVQQFKTAVSKFQSEMEKVEDPLFAPLVSTLVSLSSERNFSDQGILKKILALLAKIQKNLRNFIKNRNADHKKILKLLETQLSLKHKQLRDLNKLLLAANSEIRFYGDVIHHADLSAALIRQQLAKKNRELKHWNHLCAHEKSYHARINKEIGQFQANVKALEAAASHLV